MDEKTLWVQTLWNPLNELKKSPLESKEQGIRVAAYCRVSSDRNNFSSLINQVSYYTEYIKNRDNWKFAGIYYDIGKSGANIDKRPAIKRMIRHCKEGRIDLILAKSISRFSRNIKDLIYIIEELKRYEVAVYFEAENIDTSINYNRFLLEIYTAIYQEEIENHSQLTRMGYEKRFTKGVPTYGGGLLYGYDIDENNGDPIITVNEEEAKVIRWIYEMFIDGTNYAEIAKQLIRSGVNTKTGKQIWTGKQVKNILTSLIYTGNKIARTTTKDLFTNEITKGLRDEFLFENSHPAIISKATFDRVQLRINKKSTENKSYTIRPLTRRIICGYCNQKYTIKPPTTWRCRTTTISKEFCKAEALNDKKIISMVLQALEIKLEELDLQKLLKVLEKVNQNDHFEFHRLSRLTEIEIAYAENNEDKIKALIKKYKEFEAEIRKIEDDRIYRDLAIDWITNLNSVDEFIEEITIEHIRAWALELIVYTQEEYIVKWCDGTETVVGECNYDKKPFKIDPVKIPEYKFVEREVDKEVNAEVIKINPGDIIFNNIKKGLKGNEILLPTKKKKLRVAAYCRVSTLFEEQQSSLQSQIAYYTYKILRTKNWDYAGIFSDEGLSGTQMNNRTEFNKMIEKCKEGKIDLILVKSISRFSRNTVEALETTRMLKALPNPCYCFFEKESILTSDSKADFLLSLHASLGQEEISNLSHNIKWGISKKAERGFIHMATDIYGYTIDKKRNWTVVEEEAEVIRLIAKELLEGKSISEIIKNLYKKGIKSPSGKDYWDDSHIREMLRNEKYKGDYLFQKTFTPEVIGAIPRVNRGEATQYYIENHHPAIIVPEEWDLIQEEMSKRTKAPVIDPKPSRTAGRASFYQRLFCRDCGAVLSRYRSRGRTREGSDWRCYNTYGKAHKTCNNRGFRQEYIEYNFMKTICENEEIKKLVEKEMKRLKLTSKDELKVEELNERIEALNQQLYEVVDEELSKSGQDIKRINYLTEEIVKYKNELKIFEDRAEKIKSNKRELKNLLKYKLKPMGFREFHNMDVRINPGDSLYDTTKNAEDITYIKEDKDNFREDIFEKYVVKGEIDGKGYITYTFIFGIEFGIKMTYEEYLEELEKTKADINFEELLISREVQQLTSFCKEAKTPKEMREYLNISSRVSFDKRILKPLYSAGKFGLIRGKCAYDWRYYWTD